MEHHQLDTVSPSFVSRLYTHALQSVFANLTLRELMSAQQVSREWCRVTNVHSVDIQASTRRSAQPPINPIQISRYLLASSLLSMYMWRVDLRGYSCNHDDMVTLAVCHGLQWLRVELGMECVSWRAFSLPPHLHTLDATIVNLPAEENGVKGLTELLLEAVLTAPLTTLAIRYAGLNTFLDRQSKRKARFVDVDFAPLLQMQRLEHIMIDIADPHHPVIEIIKQLSTLVSLPRTSAEWHDGWDVSAMRALLSPPHNLTTITSLDEMLVCREMADGGGTIPLFVHLPHITHANLVVEDVPVLAALMHALPPLRVCELRGDPGISSPDGRLDVRHLRTLCTSRLESLTLTNLIISSDAVAWFNTLTSLHTLQLIDKRWYVARVHNSCDLSALALPLLKALTLCFTGGPDKREPWSDTKPSRPDDNQNIAELGPDIWWPHHHRPLTSAMPNVCINLFGDKKGYDEYVNRQQQKAATRT